MFGLLWDAFVRRNEEEFAVQQTTRRRRRRQQRASVSDPFICLSETAFIKTYRLSKALTLQLTSILGPHIPIEARSDGLSVQTKVLTALAFFAVGSYQTLVGQSKFHHISQPSVSRAVREVVQALNTTSVFQQFVKFPFNREERQSIKTVKKMESRANWFSESCEMWPGATFSFEIKKVLHKEKSEFQNIEVFDTTSLGRVLVLDGIIQCTEKDEFSYQEMISFLPLCCHKNPEKVLIVGGGDGGVAREVAKHPKVKEIVQVEIDAKVIEVSKKYLPFMACGFDSKKLTLHVCDGFEFMKNHSAEFDVIITDSSDPVGPAVSLFQENYFSLMKSALKPNGIVCSQAGTIWNDLELVNNTLKFCRNQFPSAAYAYTSVPTYPSGQIGFVVGSLEKDKQFVQPELIFTRDEEKAMSLRYYNSDVHRAAFVLPTFVKYQLV